MIKHPVDIPHRELKVRQDLAAAYQILADLQMDDLTYTHLSARLPKDSSFYMYPFGFLFEEVTASSLLRINLEGEILEGASHQYNRTGFTIHGSIYRHRPNFNAIFHLHTPAGVAVSAMTCGLLPISQWALHFYNRISYYNYRSLELDETTQDHSLLEDLGTNKIMMLRNHGILTCGETIQEAFFYAYHLEQACKTQCLAGKDQVQLTYPRSEICEQAVQDLLGFETHLGQRDWKALIRKLERKGSTYKS